MMLIMRGVLLAVMMTLSMAVQVKLDPELGISETLARERAARVSNLRYDLAFTVPSARNEPVSGRALIRFALSSAADPLVLDYQPDKNGFLRRGEGNGKETQVRPGTRY